MTVLDPLVLPPGVVLVPVGEMPDALLENIRTEPGDFALTRPATRTLSKIVDSDLASLIQQFRSPMTIAQAVLRYSLERSASPQETLESAFPLLESLLRGQLLVPAGSAAARATRASLHPGATVGRWQIISVVQSLEDSELCQVRDDANAVFALKILKPDCGSEAAAALSRERALLNFLDGCVVPRVFEAGNWEDRPYIILSWLPGIDVMAAADECRNSPNPRAGLLRLCRAVLDAYAEIHERGVIHGDVHPRNLIVGPDGAVRLIDFGLGRRIDADQSVTRGGVSFFFEPEFAHSLLSGLPVPASSKQGEQYAVAALLYLVLTSQHYTHFSLERDEQLRQIHKSEMDPFSATGTESWPEAEALLAVALQKGPSKRFPSMRDFDRAWKRLSSPPVVHHLPDRDQFSAFVNAAVEGFEIDGLTAQPGGIAPPTASLKFGSAGIAYALYRICCARSEPSLLALADYWADRSLRSIDHPDAFYREELELTELTVGRISPYHAQPGVFAVRAFIDQALADPYSERNSLAGFLESSRQSCQNFDLALGTSGTILGCALLRDSSSLPHGEITQLDALARQSLSRLWDHLNALPPIHACTAQTNLGIAHGWAGFLYSTLVWRQVSGDELPDQVLVRLYQLAGLAEPFARGLRWKWELGAQNYMPGWCNGSAGHVHLWTAAYRSRPDEIFLRMAEGAAWNAWETPASVPNLCCGLAGQAYALLNFYQLTHEPKWLSMAEQMTSRAIHLCDTRRPGPDPKQEISLRDESLYKGKLGVAVLAAEVLCPDEAAMPFFAFQRWHS